MVDFNTPKVVHNAGNGAHMHGGSVKWCTLMPRKGTDNVKTIAPKADVGCKTLVLGASMLTFVSSLPAV